MNPVVTSLIKGGTVVTDGGWTTALQALGLELGASSESWNLTHPDLVAQVAACYVEAGSLLILTNTFGANPAALNRFGLADRFEEINRLGAEISRAAAGSGAAVFGSIGPAGAPMSIDEATRSARHDVYQRHAAALAEGGADAVVIETMTDLEEAVIALRAVRETGLPCAVCMTFGADPCLTLTGASPEQALERLIGEGADIVGANCGTGPETMLLVCRRMAVVSGSTPLWMKPNAGLPQIADGRAFYDLTPQKFAKACVALVEAGAAFIGGCCGAGPEHIRALCAQFN